MQRGYPSRLSRNELYSYGFKEGQPWGNDRRSLEAALQAMDRLELDIQQNYLERRSSPYSHNNFAAAPAPSPSRYYHGGSGAGRHYHVPQYPTPDVRIARSNDSGSSAGAPQLSREWSSGGGGRTGYGTSTGRGSQYWDASHSSRNGWQAADQPPSPVSHRSPGWAERYVQPPPPPPPPQYYDPPPPTSPTRHRSTKSSHRAREESANYYDSRQQTRQQQQPHHQYHSPAPTASRISSRHSGDSRTQPMSPSQWQVSRVVNGRGENYDEDHELDGEQQQYQDHRDSSSVASPNWSTGASRDSASEDRQLSVASSPGTYSQASLDSGYTRSSGYVESFDASSQYSDEDPGYGPYGEQEGVYPSNNDGHYTYQQAEDGPDGVELYEDDETEYVYGEEDEVYSDRGGYSDHGGYSDGGYSDDAYSDGGSYGDEYD